MAALHFEAKEEDGKAYLAHFGNCDEYLCIQIVTLTVMCTLRMSRHTSNKVLLVCTEWPWEQKGGFVWNVVSDEAKCD